MAHVKGRALHADVHCEGTHMLVESDGSGDTATPAPAPRLSPERAALLARAAIIEDDKQAREAAREAREKAKQEKKEAARQAKEAKKALALEDQQVVLGGPHTRSASGRGRSRSRSRGGSSKSRARWKRRKCSWTRTSTRI